MRTEGSEIRADYLAFGRPSFSDEEIAAVARVLRSGWVGMGPEVIQFEAELAAYLGAPHVVTVNSCTSALFLSLLASGVGAGDDVLCPSLTWCSTANVAVHLGARPVFCDVDPESLCITAETVRARLTPRTRAVVVVHFGGRAADVDSIRRALPPQVALVEDAAHALGAAYPNGNRVGSSGNLTCFSFYANKNLSTGDGGAIALRDPTLADRLRTLRQSGLPADAWKRFSHARSMLYTELTEVGYKMNYTDLQASLGRVQLRRQPEFESRRSQIADVYGERLPSLLPGVRFQKGVRSPEHARHLFLILLPLESMSLTRDELLVGLRHRNIGATIHYAPLHRMPLYRERGTDRLPVTESVAERILSLPLSASMTLADAEYVLLHLQELAS